MHTLIEYGKPNADGEKLLGYIDGLLEAAGTDPAKLNALPGIVQHYFNNVTQLHAITPVRFLEDYPSQLDIVRDNMRMQEAADAQAAEVVTTVGTVKTLEAKFAALEAVLQEQQTANAALKEQVAALESAKGKKGKPAPADTEADTSTEEEG